MKGVSRISTQVYAFRSGVRILVVEKARFVLRRAGRFVQHWLKYLVGKLSTTGEKIWICLGEANRSEIESWMMSSNGQGLSYVLRLLEHMVSHLGLAKCLAIATIALQENGCYDS